MNICLIIAFVVIVGCLLDSSLRTGLLCLPLFAWVLVVCLWAVCGLFVLLLVVWLWMCCFDF